MTKLTSKRAVLSRVTIFMFAMVTLAAGLAPQNSFAQNGYQDTETLRSDLLAVVEIQKSLEQDFRAQSAENDSSLALIERAIIEADALTGEELETLRKLNFSLAPALQSLQALESAVSPDANQIALQATTGTSANVPTCDGYVEAGQFDDPPGPCGQTNYEPDDRPPDYTPVPLTDNLYPDFPTCRSYTQTNVVFATRAAVVALDVTASVARRVCDQIYTGAGVGANIALVCLVTETAFLVVKRIKTVIKFCHSFRIASEGTSTYVRSGELFVQSRQNTNTIINRADAGFDESQNGLTAISNQVEENSLKIEQTIATLNEIMRTMKIEDARLFEEDRELD